MDLTDRSILVAGATGGLGSRIAAELHRRGARLTLAGRDGARLDGLPVPGVRVTVDLRLPDAAERAVSIAAEAHGRLDGVVNAAGVVLFGPLADASPDAIEEAYLSNTLLPAFLFGAAVPRLEDGGVLVNLTGVVAEQPVAGMAAYSGSKAAVSAMLVALRKEVRRRGITVVDARPGHTETGLASRPIEGAAPAFRAGLDPSAVARRIVDAIERDEPDLPPAAFSG